MKGRSWLLGTFSGAALAVARWLRWEHELDLARELEEIVAEIEELWNAE